MNRDVEEDPESVFFALAPTFTLNGNTQHYDDTNDLPIGSNRQKKQ